MHFLALILVALTAKPAAQAEGKALSEKMKSFLQLSDRERLEQIKATQQSLKKQQAHFAAAKRGRIDPSVRGIHIDASTGRVTYSTAESKEREIESVAKRLEELTVRLDQLKRNDPPYFATFPDEPPKVGLIGRLRDNRLFVRQVIDRENMIVKNTWSAKMTAYADSLGRLRYRPDSHDVSFWVKGYPTAGIADNSKVEPTDVFEITGTKTYKSVDGGSTTLLVIEPLDMSGIPIPQPKSKRKPEPERAKLAVLRTWTSADGKFTVEARFSKYMMGTVYLEKQDGTEIKVPMGKLSGADQEFIKTRGR